MTSKFKITIVKHNFYRMQKANIPEANALQNRQQSLCTFATPLCTYKHFCHNWQLIDPIISWLPSHGGPRQLNRSSLLRSFVTVNFIVHYPLSSLLQFKSVCWLALFFAILSGYLIIAFLQIMVLNFALSNGNHGTVLNKFV